MLVGTLVLGHSYDLEAHVEEQLEEVILGMQLAEVSLLVVKNDYDGDDYGGGGGDDDRRFLVDEGFLTPKAEFLELAQAVHFFAPKLVLL